jgi:ABC-type transporter Mla subunit MlaD
MQKNADEPMTTQPLGTHDAAAAQALVDLSAGVLPVWARHLATSRAQSEVAVTEMLQAFSDIGPHINMAERQSQQIADALSHSDNGIIGLATACERALNPLLTSAQLPEGGTQAITQVLDMVRTAVRALEEIAKPFSHETQMVAAQVERMYVGFQYQDRISQMMALLEGDIARLREALDNKASEPPALAEWLARLESNYAMAEQRQDHQGQSAAGAASADNNETTFF